MYRADLADFESLRDALNQIKAKETKIDLLFKTIINTSSNAFKVVKAFDPDTLERLVTYKKLFGPYTSSKLALSLWTREIAPLLAVDGIQILSVDLGANNTIRKGKNSGVPLYLKRL